jgi:hypothetical protein
MAWQAIQAVLWMIQKSDIQRPRMVANAGRLVERREARASHSWGQFCSATAVQGEPSVPRQRACPLIAGRAKGKR